MSQFKRGLVMLIVSASLSACATTSTLIAHHGLDVQTKMSDSIFLDPLPSEQRTVFIEIKNTSDKPDFEINKAVADKIGSSGWTVVQNPNKATLLLQANILSVGKTSMTAAQQALHAGYGGVLGSAIVGAGAAAAAGGNGTAIGASGLALGAADYVGGLLVKDITYAAIVDVQLSERSDDVSVTVASDQTFQQGNSGVEHQTFAEHSKWKRYRTRILSTAEQANLSWTDAEPAIADGLSQVLRGLL